RAVPRRGRRRAAGRADFRSRRGGLRRGSATVPARPGPPRLSAAGAARLRLSLPPQRLTRKAMDDLVSTEWLADRLGEPGVVVLDASAHLPDAGRDVRAEFVAAHIPGAR